MNKTRRLNTTENNTQILYYFLLNMPECFISCIMQHHKELNEISYVATLSSYDDTVHVWKEVMRNPIQLKPCSVFMPVMLYTCMHALTLHFSLSDHLIIDRFCICCYSRLEVFIL